MRHVEEVLDEAEPRGADLHRAAGDGAPIRLVGLGEIEDVADGGARLVHRKP